MNYIESLKWRYATKKFNTNRTLDFDVLERILEAANLSASSLGLQAIQLVRVENKELREKVLVHSYNQRQVVDSSELIVICIDTEISNEKVDQFIQRVASVRNQESHELNGYKNMINSFISNFPDKAPMFEWLSKQAYIVLGTLLTACALEKVDSCPMEGFKPHEVAADLGLDEKGLFPVLMLPIGYRAIDDKNQHLKKVRKPISEYVMTI